MQAKVDARLQRLEAHAKAKTAQLASECEAACKAWSDAVLALLTDDELNFLIANYASPHPPEIMAL